MVHNGAVSRWSLTTKTLWFTCAVYTFGDVLFGIDTGSFGSLQALPSFLNTFGQDISGVKSFTADRRATMNSVVWLGKLVGTIIFEPILERFGFKITTFVSCFVQCVALIIQLTAKEWIQFSCGRVLAYLAVGMIENVVPAYTSEVAPVELRAFFTGCLPLFVVGGNLWGAGMSRAFVTETQPIGWIIPVAVQLIPAVIMLIFVPLTPESPRWLLSKDRRAEAVKSLNRLRPKKEQASGMNEMEADAITEAIHEGRQIGEGRWRDLVSRNYIQRSAIAMGIFIFQQSTGVQFINSYLPTFLTSIGLGAKSFTYVVINNAMQMVAALCAMISYDKLGRRPVEITGAFLQFPFMLAFGYLSGLTSPTDGQTNTLVACFIMYSFWTRISHASCCWILTSELGGVRMRKKIMALGTGTDVVAACIWTVAVPYMLTSMGPKVGYFFGAVGAAGFIFAVLCVPELKGRSLEEVDELFEARLWAWQFNKYKTTGVGARIAQLEAGVKAEGDIHHAENQGSDEAIDEKGIETRREYV